LQEAFDRAAKNKPVVLSNFKFDPQQNSSISTLVSAEMEMVYAETVKTISSVDSEFQQLSLRIATISYAVFTAVVTSYDSMTDRNLMSKYSKDFIEKLCRSWYFRPDWKLPKSYQSQISVLEKRFSVIANVVNRKNFFFELITQSNLFFSSLEEVAKCESTTTHPFLSGIEFPGNQTIIVSDMGRGGIVVEPQEITIDFGSLLTSNELISRELRIENQTGIQQIVKVEGPRDSPFKYSPATQFKLVPPGREINFSLSLKEKGLFRATLTLTIVDQSPQSSSTASTASPAPSLRSQQVVVNLIGCVEAIAVSCEPKEIDFGSVCAGVPPQPQFVTVHNETGVTMRVFPLSGTTKLSSDLILRPRSHVSIKASHPLDQQLSSELLIAAGVSAREGDHVLLRVPVRVHYDTPCFEVWSDHPIVKGSVLETVELEYNEEWSKWFDVKNEGRVPVYFRVTVKTLNFQGRTFESRYATVKLASSIAEADGKYVSSIVEVGGKSRFLLELRGDEKYGDHKVTVEIEPVGFPNSIHTFSLTVRTGRRSFITYGDVITFLSKLSVTDGKENALHAAKTLIQSESSVLMVNKGDLSILFKLPVVKPNRVKFTSPPESSFPYRLTPGSRVEIRASLTVYSFTEERGDVFLETNRIADAGKAVRICSYEHSVSKPVLQLEPQFLCFYQTQLDHQSFRVSNIGKENLKVVISFSHSLPEFAKIDLQIEQVSLAVKTPYQYYIAASRHLLLTISADLSACPPDFEEFFQIKIDCENDIVFQSDSSPKYKTFFLPILLSRSFDRRFFTSSAAGRDSFNLFFCTSPQLLDIFSPPQQSSVVSQSLMVQTVGPVLELLRAALSNLKGINLLHPLLGTNPETWTETIVKFLKNSPTVGSEESRRQTIKETFQATPSDKHKASALWMEKLSSHFTALLHGAPVALSRLLTQENTSHALQVSKMLFARCFSDCYESAVFNQCVDVLSAINEPKSLDGAIDVVHQLLNYLPEIGALPQSNSILL
jgi:hypothetical protein